MRYSRNSLPELVMSFYAVDRVTPEDCDSHDALIEIESELEKLKVDPPVDWSNPIGTRVSQEQAMKEPVFDMRASIDYWEEFKEHHKVLVKSSSGDFYMGVYEGVLDGRYLYVRIGANRFKPVEHNSEDLRMPQHVLDCVRDSHKKPRRV